MNINLQDQGEVVGNKSRQSLPHQSQIISQPSKSTFISKVERFLAPSQQTPGPGSYSPQFMQKHTKDLRQSKHQESQPGSFNIPKEHAWIYSRARMSICPTSNPLGPGEYGQIMSQSRSRHSDWGKCQRFQNGKASQNNLGPGAYDAKKGLKQSLAPISVFKSQLPRTFIEQMITKSSKDQKKIKNPENEEHQQIIKFEENEYEVRKKVDRLSPVFQSKQQRPELMSHQASVSIGPGSYSLESSFKLGKKPLKSPLLYNLGSLRQQGSASNLIELGPGSYNISSAISSEKFGKKQPLGVFNAGQRFQKSVPTKVVPGPGQYMQQRFTMIKEDDLHFKNKGSFDRKPEKGHHFGSSPRSTLRNGNKVPFGEYNLKQFDIERKMEKQKDNLQKLKMMEVTLPVFNTKVHS